MKTLLKMAIGVLILSGIFFGILKFLDQGKSTSSPAPVVSPTPEETATPVAGIDDVSVTPTEKGVSIQIKNVVSPAYELTVSDNHKEISVDFPGVPLLLTKRMMPLPHAMVELIEADETVADTARSAKVKMVFTDAVTHSEKIVGDMLVIDVEKEGEKQADETAQVDEAPAVKAPVKKAIVKKPAVKAVPKKPAIKKSVAKKRSTPSEEAETTPLFDEPSPVIEPEPTVAPVAKETPKEDDFLKELGLDDATINAKSQAPAVEPSLESPKVEAKGSDKSVDELFTDPGFGGATDEVKGSGSMPKLPDQPFDPNKVTTGLPSLRNVSVTPQGGVTRVVIQRDARTQYKMFPLRNPSRVVVDFLNAVNQLPADQGGVSGTKIQRITSKQFVGPEGTITRVTFYLNGTAPSRTEISKDSKGKDFIFDIP